MEDRISWHAGEHRERREGRCEEAGASRQADEGLQGKLRRMGTWHDRRRRPPLIEDWIYAVTGSREVVRRTSSREDYRSGSTPASARASGGGGRI